MIEFVSITAHDQEQDLKLRRTLLSLSVSCSWVGYLIVTKKNKPSESLSLSLSKSVSISLYWQRISPAILVAVLRIFSGGSLASFIIAWKQRYATVLLLVYYSLELEKFLDTGGPTWYPCSRTCQAGITWYSPRAKKILLELALLDGVHRCPKK